MRHFIEKRFADRPAELVAERASFYACCKVVDIILAMKTGVIDARSVQGRDLLSDAMCSHLRLHRAAYGDEHVKPKHNLNLSLPNQFFKKGVFDAFTSERLHLLVKVIAERTKKHVDLRGDGPWETCVGRKFCSNQLAVFEERSSGKDTDAGRRALVEQTRMRLIESRSRRHRLLRPKVWCRESLR